MTYDGAKITKNTGRFESVHIRHIQTPKCYPVLSCPSRFACSLRAGTVICDFAGNVKETANENKPQKKAKTDDGYQQRKNYNIRDGDT